MEQRQSARKSLKVRAILAMEGQAPAQGRTSDIGANGVSITGRTRGPEVVEHHEDGTSTMTVMNVVSRQIPGLGTVMQQAGRVVVELDENGDQIGDATFEAGQFDDPSEVCAAFE